MPKDNRRVLPPTPSSPYSEAHLRRSERLRRTADTSNPPDPTSAFPFPAAGPSTYPVTPSTPHRLQHAREPFTPSSAGPSTSSRVSAVWEPLTPATPPISRTYSRASRNGHRDQVRQPSVESVSSTASTESDYLPTPLEVLQQLPSAPQNLAPDATVIREVCETVELCGTCKICFQPMARPYITPCGHGFCGVCLRDTFRAHLQRKLATLLTKDHDLRFAHETRECQLIPTSDFDQPILVRALKDHGCDPSKVFTYDCPECRVSITTEPVVNYPLLHMLESQRRVLKGRVNMDGLSGGKDPIYLFQGLFWN
ncbi:hypothetical protein EST38_g13032 [Candolleomyces aberdarensis]|uniref:RING-type domain-containing protein n=1 Tax=Candolleomyces aberdarensis TaxID=2316362 RepID=A0A4Q2D393_9AGAR|nr:hypothetical protein EST38_g13032 [Candolleomyces aberdarensis]